MVGKADLSQIARMWATERYTGHWDGYSGTRANFGRTTSTSTVISRESSRCFPGAPTLPGANRLPFEGGAGLLFDRCLADASCSAAYETSLSEASAAITTVDLDSRAVAIAELLLPWQLIDPRQEYTVAEITEAIEDTRAFIAGRPAELIDWLAEPKDEPAAACDASRSLLLAALCSVAVGRDRDDASRSLGGCRWFPRHPPRPAGAGRVSKRASIDTASGPVVACASRPEVKGAGTTTLRCQLSADARRRLRARWLKLKVEIQFSLQGRAPNRSAAPSSPVAPHLTRGKSGPPSLMRHMGAKGDSPDGRAARTASRQHGVVSVDQLRRAGVTKDGVRRRIEAGRLHRLHRGVYAVGHTLPARRRVGWRRCWRVGQMRH